MIRNFLAGLALSVGLASGASAATLLFSDNFDANMPGTKKVPAGWVITPNNGVTGGTVDIIGNGYFDFYPGNGYYIDMDGSSSKAGRIETATQFLANAGDWFEISFSYAKNGSHDEVLHFGFGGWSGTLALNDGAISAFQSITFKFQALTTGLSSLFFAADTTGPINEGPIIDNVALYAAPAVAAVPVPAAGFLLMGGLGGLAMLRRRKSPAVAA